jgi:hypothetical protein
MESNQKQELVVLEDPGYNETKEDTIEDKSNTRKHISNSLKSNSPVNQLVINGVGTFKG